MPPIITSLMLDEVLVPLVPRCPFPTKRCGPLGGKEVSLLTERRYGLEDIDG